MKRTDVRHTTGRAEQRARDAEDELSDDDLACVVGGLARAWIRPDGPAPVMEMVRAVLEPEPVS